MGIKLTIDKMLFADKIGTETMDVNGKTVGECLSDAVDRHPAVKKAIFDEGGALRSSNLVRVNGEYISSNRLAASVKVGDSIEIARLTGE